MMHQQDYANGLMLSDSKEIVDSARHKQPVIQDWRSFREVWEAWQLLNLKGGNYSTSYCSRDDPAIQISHQLANLGRVNGWDRNSQGVEIRCEDMLHYVSRDLMQGLRVMKDTKIYIYIYNI